MSTKLNRRELLVAGGAVGAAAAAVSALGPNADAGVGAGSVRTAGGCSRQNDRRTGDGGGARLSRSTVRLWYSRGADQRVVGCAQSPFNSLPSGRE